MTVQSEYFARDLIDSGLLAFLKQHFDLYFIAAAKLKSDISPFGTILIRGYEPGFLRHRIWRIGYGSRSMAVIERFWRKFANRYKVLLRGYERRYRVAVILLSKLGLANVTYKILRKILFWTTPSIVPNYIELALLPTGIYDPVWDDVLSDCKRKKIPSLTITMNWDNIAGKLFFQQPEFLGVWGQQGYLMARLFQDIPDERLITVGTPRFESHLRSTLTQTEARKALEIPEGSRMLLFAGSGGAFDEVSLLEEFESAMAAGTLPSDLVMYYKPHPLRHPRKIEPPLRAGEYKHIKVFQGEGLTPLEQYPLLIKAAEAVVSPLSTMMLEAALLGVPSLGLAYDHPHHAEMPWSLFRHQYHLRAVTDGDWYVACYAREDFLQSISRILEVANNEEIKQRMKSAATFAVHIDNRSYPERILDALTRISSAQTRS